MALALVLAGLAMGIAATPHCVTMCGTPCAALTRGGRRCGAGFQGGRMAGYMAAGALAGGSVSVLGHLEQMTPALQPLWVVVHLAFLALGLCWLVTGRTPAFLTRRAAAPGVVVVHGPAPVLRATAAGLAWVAWPCAALQGALAVAALASGPAEGALVMAAYAAGSMPALAAGSWLWSRWPLAGMGRERAQTLGLRVAGLATAAAAAWAIGHEMWAQVAAWCTA